MQKANFSRTALITGGSSGIGLAIAKKFSQENIPVTIADIEIPKESIDKSHYKSCDVTKGEDINALFSWMNNTHKLPEILVINAGRGIREKLTEGDPEKWQKIIDLNVMGALRCIRAFVPAMLERENGHIVFISSVSASQPHPYGGIYSAAKTALEVIAETLRQETLPHLNVTVVSPGVTNTNFFANEISGNTSISDLNMGAISPEEIAEDVFYAINKRAGTGINKIVTRPTSQGF